MEKEHPGNQSPAVKEEVSAGVAGFLPRKGGPIDSLASIKDINYLKIANLVHSVQAISRTEIASRLSLSKTTVSAVIGRLLSDNIVRETGKGDSRGGRKPRLVGFNRQLKVCLGVEIGDRECVGILTDIYAQPIEDPVVVEIDERFEPDGWRGRREILETIRRLTAGHDPSTVLGVGIGIPGIYDYRSHSIVIAESLGLQNFSTRTLEETIGFPVKVINRANAAALGEKWYGLGRKVSSMIFVSVGGGIGAGIILEGRLLMGSTGSAGEIGHSVILPHGPVCRCGSSGCLESLVSSDLLLARVRELVRKVPGCLLRRQLREESDPITLPMIEAAAREGDEHIRRLLDRYGEYIGLALANAVNLFDPQLVVVGGEMGTMFGEFLVPAITRMIRLHARYFREVEVAVSQLGRLAVAVGACAFLM